MDAETIQPNRPFGVLVIAVFQILAALGSLLLMAIYADMIHLDWLDVPVELDSNLILTSIALAFARSVTVIGLLRLKHWGWLLAMIVTGVLLITDLSAYLNNTPNYLSMLTNIIVVFYLNQRDVRRAFQQQHGERMLPDD
jgi:hypothetical protein